MVLSILNSIPAWHPYVTRMKEMENFRKSCLRWGFGSKLPFEQQLKSYDILPCVIKLSFLRSQWHPKFLVGGICMTLLPILTFVFMIEPQELKP